MNEESIYDKAERVLKEFNYEKVHAYMLLTNWGWRGKGTPTIEEIKQTASLNMYQAIKTFRGKGEDNQESTMTGTGGFYAYIFNWGGKAHIKMTFEPFKYETF